MQFGLMETGLLCVSATLVVSSLTQFAAAGVDASRRGIRADRRRRNMIDYWRNAATVARLQSDLRTRQQGWRVMEVVEVVSESADCKSYYLVDPSGQSLPDFRPGQHLMVRPALTAGIQATRCYSLSSSPDSRYWRVTIKRQELAEDSSRSSSLASPSNRGLSRWLHQNIEAGDYLLVGDPNGQFYLPESQQEPIVLLAAGVGVTPLVSMLQWSLQHTPDRYGALMYQAKDQEHWPLGEAIHEWLRGHRRVRAISYFSRLSKHDVQDRFGTSAERSPDFRAGKIETRMLQKLSRTLPTAHYYMCGPDAWMKNIREELTGLGIDAERIHWESFGGAALKENADGKTATQQRQIAFERSGVTATWTDPTQSVWELARENGIELPSGCLSGACGSCRVRKLSGEVRHRVEPGVDISADECLACVAEPTSDLRLDA